MSKLDDKYIESLGTFTTALEEIVELLKEQQKNGKSDVVNDFLKTPMDDLSHVVKDLQKITEDGFKNVKTDNEKILQKIDGIKKQKESGMFGSIEDPKNKNKIVDGIKVVILIAGGVLALGLAFKIIGKVDFLSVIALSTSMIAMSIAYSKIADIKNLKYTNILLISSIMPLMAIGLALSGYILKRMPEFSKEQSNSILYVSIAMGLATYLLMKSISKISISSIKMIPLLPLILPMIAWGIVKSSQILKNVEKMSFAQVLSVGMIGLALGVATFGISIALKGLKNVTYKEMLALPFMIPLIAEGIVLASKIFKGFVPLGSRSRSIDLLIGSAIIGLSLLFFTPAIYVLGKMKIEDVLTGALMILPLSYAITQSSIIFSKFILLKEPLNVVLSTLAMGLSILIFTPAIYVLGKMPIEDLLIGIGGSILTSIAIVVIANIFSSLPTKMITPDFMWTLSAGLAVGGFALIATAVGLFAGTDPFFWIGLAAILAVAGTIVIVSYMLQAGNYTKYPPLDWALGVGGSLIAFSSAIVIASVGGIASAISKVFTGDEDPLIKIANTMVAVSWLLQSGKWESGYPKLEWALGVGTAFTMFAAAYVAITGLQGINRVFSFLTGTKSQSFNDFVISAANAMKTANAELSGVNWGAAGSYPSKDYADGVGGLLKSFAETYAVVSLVGSSIFSINPESFEVFVKNAANSMLVAKTILDSTNWTNAGHPTKEYSDGIGSFLISMATAYTKVNDIGIMGILAALFNVGNKMTITDFVKESSTAIVIASNILSSGNFTNIPDAEYLTNFNNFIVSMAKNINDFNVNINDVMNFTNNLGMLSPSLLLLSNATQSPLSDLYIQGFDKLVKLLDSMPDKSTQIHKLADSFVDLSNSLKDITTFDNLSKVSASVVLLSAVDDVKLQIILDKLKDNQETIKTIYGNSSSTPNLVQSVSKAFDKIFNSDSIDSNKKPNEELIITTKMEPQFYSEFNEVKSLLRSIKNSLDKPAPAQSFHR